MAVARPEQNSIQNWKKLMKKKINPAPYQKKDRNIKISCIKKRRILPDVALQ
jgi:transposase